jgi:hypothetical protein
VQSAADEGRLAGATPGGSPAAAPDGRPAPGHGPVAGPAVRQALVGEMCPERAGGRPALSLVSARQVGWSTDPEELDALARRSGARPFVVLSATGRRAGVFTGVGPVDLATELPTLTGGYAGQAPCDKEDAACLDAQGSCGLAVASLAVDGEAEAPPMTTGAACVDGGQLRVDLDGDGAAESFAITAFLDEVKAPADEVLAAATAGKLDCAPRFSAPALLRGKDAKAFRALDLLGVVDIDGDGRLELVMQYRYATVRTWAIYATEQHAGRLELRAEVAPWSAE